MALSIKKVCETLKVVTDVLASLAKLAAEVIKIIAALA